MKANPPISPAGKPPKPSRQPLSRSLAAAIGGYGFTATITALLAVTLPLPRTEATTAATLLSILVYVAVILWAFTARSAAFVWLVLGGTSLAGLLFAAARGIYP